VILNIVSKPAIVCTVLEKIDQLQRGKDRNDQWQSRKAVTKIIMRLPEQLLKASRNFIFISLLEKASGKLRNHFRMNRKYYSDLIVELQKNQLIR
jgi:hypothetical protein